MKSVLRNYSLPIIVFLILGILFCPATGRDDSHILYWPAYTLTEYGSIVNYNGQFIEQATSLGFVLLVAASSTLVPVKLPVLGVILSCLFGVLTCLYGVHLTKKLEINSSLWVGLLIATSTYVIYWSFSGMEMTLTAFLSILLISSIHDFLESNQTVPGGLFLFILFSYLLVRPESVFILSCLLAGALLLEWFFDISLKPRKLVTVFLFTISFYSLIVTFRVIYFGSFFPLPVQSKVSPFSARNLRNGIDYVWTNFSSLHSIPLFLGSIVCLLFLLIKLVSGKQPKLSRLGWLLTLFVVSYSGFVVGSGGDWMKGGRFLVPLIPPLVLVVCQILSEFPTKFSSIVIPLAILIQITGFVVFINNKSTSKPLWKVFRNQDADLRKKFSWVEVARFNNYRDLRFIIKFQQILTSVLEKETPPITILSGQGGIVPYYLAKNYYGKIHWVDSNGLVSSDFHHCYLKEETPKSSMGLGFYKEYLVKNLDKITANCLSEYPDFIYYLDFPPPLPEKYDLIHFESFRHPSIGSNWLAIKREIRLKTNLGEIDRSELVNKLRGKQHQIRDFPTKN